MKRLIPEQNTADIKKLAHNPETAFRKELEVDVLARTLWGEARGESSAGMQAVANVVINRLAVSECHDGYWWGDTIIQICQKPYQFSCWNKDDPNLTSILSIDESADMYFATAKRLARRAVYAVLPDITNGATHYHAAGITPSWAIREKPVCVIGAHIFYRLVQEYCSDTQITNGQVQDD